MFFNLLLTQAETQLQLASQAREQSAPRAFLFIALALKVVDLFEENSAMSSFTLSSTLSVQDVHEGEERAVLLKRVVAIDAPGCPELTDFDKRARLALSLLPSWLMGDGTLHLTPSNPLVEAVRVPEVDSEERHARAFRLAMYIDSCFQQFRAPDFVEVAE